MRGHSAVLDVDDFEHYVAAIGILADGRVVLVDPAGDRRDEDFADVALCSPRDLLRRWRCTDDQDDAFWAVGVVAAPAGGAHQRLPFTPAAVRRYRHGRRKVLTEFLVDAVEMADHASPAPGTPVALSDVVRDVAKVVVPEVAWFCGADTKLTAELHRAVEDIAIVSGALQVPSGSTTLVASALASLLMRHLHSL